MTILPTIIVFVILIILGIGCLLIYLAYKARRKRVSFSIDVQKEYGIIPDGKTDNAPALMAMRSELAGKNKPHHVLVFPPGEIVYSNNRWLFGIYSFEVTGNNTTFRSLYNGNDDAFQRPLFVGEMFQNNTLEYIGTKIYETADLFDPITAGASIIHISRVFNQYQAGDRVLLYAGNYAADGYPPPATAEWHEIESMSGQTITLKRPLENNYPGGVWDNPVISGGGCGLSRILNLDRAENVYCKYARFTGVTFGNATGGGAGNVIFPADRLEMIRCKGEGFFWPSENRTALFEDMDVNEVEFDKLVDKVVCNRVNFTGSPNGGGSINSIEINDCRAGESMRFDPRDLVILNSHIRGNSNPDSWISSLSDYPARNPVRRITIGGLTFSSGPGSLTDTHINKMPFNSMQIDLVDGKKIKTSVFDLVKTMEPGTTILFNEDGSDGGLITSITHDGQFFVISGNWNKVSPASVWRWCYVKEVIDRGGHRVLDGKRLSHGTSIRWKGNTSTGPVKEMHLTEKDFIWHERGNGNFIVDMYCQLETIECFVAKPYGHNGAMISIQRGDDYKDLFTANLKVTGATTSHPGQWVKQIVLNTYNVTGPVSPDVLPKFDIVVKWRPF